MFLIIHHFVAFISIQFHQTKKSHRRTIFEQKLHGIMSSMNFSTSKQYVRPPQRGIFPLDHDAECRPYMEVSHWWFILFRF